jgi:hypothetical protein
MYQRTLKKKERKFSSFRLCNRFNLNFLIYEESFLFLISAFGDLLRICFTVEYDYTPHDGNKNLGTFDKCEKNVYFYS